MGGLIGRGAFLEMRPYAYPPQNGQMYREYQRSYRDTMVGFSGYSVELRAKVIGRWRELQAQVAKPAPVNLED